MNDALDESNHHTAGLLEGLARDALLARCAGQANSLTRWYTLLQLYLQCGRLYLWPTCAPGGDRCLLAL
jgi:hypothetical protein